MKQLPQILQMRMTLFTRCLTLARTTKKVTSDKVKQNFYNQPHNSIPLCQNLYSFNYELLLRWETSSRASVQLFTYIVIYVHIYKFMDDVMRCFLNICLQVAIIFLPNITERKRHRSRQTGSIYVQMEKLHVKLLKLLFVNL